MRGTDFRASKIGLNLILGKGLASSREEQQALARVGRYSEPCERFQVASLKDLVDPELTLAKERKLMEFLTKKGSAVGLVKSFRKETIPKPQAKR